MIGLVDTRVIGQFYQANTHLITFDPLVLPWEQFCSWVKPPEEDDTEYYISYDEGGFPLDDLSGLNVDSAVAERGEILSTNIGFNTGLRPQELLPNAGGCGGAVGCSMAFDPDPICPPTAVVGTF